MGPLTDLQHQLAALRALQFHDPTPERWAQLWALLTDWPDDQDPQVALDYAAAFATRWPDALRVPPGDAALRALRDRRLPRPWPLARALDFNHLDADDAPLDGAPPGFWTPLHALALRPYQLGPDPAARLLALARDTLPIGLERLSLRDQGLTADALRPLLTAPDLHRLQALDLSLNPLGDDIGDLIAAAPALASLEALALDYTDLGDAGLRALASAPCRPHLRRLDLASNPFHGDSLRAFGDHGGLHHLRALTLAELEWSPAAAATLGHRMGLISLETLNIRLNSLPRALLEALRGADFLPTLRDLTLYETRLHADDLDALLDAIADAPLRALRLSHLRLDEAAATLLANGPWRDLDLLELQDARLHDDALRALTQGPALLRLRALHLEQNHLTHAAVDPLLDLVERGALRQISLKYNDLGDEGAAAFASDPRAASLEALCLRNNNIQRGWEYLQRSPYLSEQARATVGPAPAPPTPAPTLW